MKDAAGMSSTPLSIPTFKVLGYPELARQDAPSPRALPDKALALLAYLALERQREHSREELATMLWPEVDGSAGRSSLRQSLHKLRQVLPDTPPVLQISRQSVGIDPASNLWVDARAFTALLDACKGHAHRRLDACPECMARCEQATALYRGDFLAGFTLPDSDAFETWQMARQEVLRGQMLGVLADLAAFRARRQEYNQAIGHLQRALSIAPWQEETHRQLMRTLALNGQRSAALNQYAACCQLLAEELDVDPAPETTALRDQIEAGLLARDQIEASNPYRGLFAFDEQHAADFYGRERLVQSLLARVQTQPLVAIVGPSGSGKSSLLHAGVLPNLYTLSANFPLLANQGGGHEQKPWRIIDLWPGADPFRALVEAFSPLLASPEDDEGLVHALRRGERSLADLIATLETPAGRVLIVVDQFEELYTLCPDMQTRRDFLDLLLAANPTTVARSDEHSIDQPAPPAETMSDAEMSPAITVILTLRADFMGQALAHRPFADAIQRGGIVVGPMSRDELRQAVEQPALNRGVDFASGLVERLLTDVGGDPGNLPLLQFCLTQLWGRQADGLLTHAAYDDIGGLAGALSRYAERNFERLSNEQQEVARQTLMRLVQPGETTADTRRWASRRELDEEGWLLVQQLADARLVVTDRTAHGQEHAALVHEALIQHWDRLQGWMEQHQALRLFQHRLLPFVRQWETTGRNTDALLRGALLAEAEEFVDLQSVGMSDSERRFIQASIAERDRRQAELEMRQRSELEQAQALAQSERREAEAANRSRHRLRWMTAGLAVALVLALLAALAATGQGRVAARNAMTAAESRVDAEIHAASAVAAQAEAEAHAAMAAAARATAVAEGARAETEAARAENQAQIALSRQLGAQAVSFADEELDTALLLSLESLRTSTSSADRRALYADLIVPPFLSTILYGPPEPIYNLGLGPESATLLSAGERGTLLNWELASGQAFSVTLPLADASDPETNEPRGFAFSPDGRLAGETHGSGLTLWDLERGEALFFEPQAHDGDIHELFFTADGKRMLSRGGEADLRLWDTDFESEISGSRLLARPTIVENGIVRAMSPDGGKLAMALEPDNFSILLWDLESGQAIGEPMPAHTAEIHGFDFNSDGSLLATASFDGSVRLWDAARGAALLESLLAHDGRVLAVDFSPDGKTLASGGTDGLIYLWDTTTGAPVGPPLAGHGNWVRALRYSDDGETLYSADADGRIVAWSVGDHRTLRGHEKRVRGVGVSPDGRFLITSSFDGAIVLWDAESGEQVRRIDDAHERSIIQIAVSPDGIIASGDAEGFVKLWDLETLKPLLSPSLGHESVVINLAFSPDGTILATGDFNGIVRLWDVATGEPLGAPLPAHEGWALSLAFSPDGAMLASGGTGGNIKLWQMPATDVDAIDLLAQVGETLTGHTNWVTWLAFGPDGETLVSTSSDRTIRFWDVITSAAQGESLVEHEAQVWSAQFDSTSDGQVLVTLGGDGSVLRWDVASRELLGPPLLTDKETETMVISPDGRSLIIGSFDETATQWHLDSRLWTERACRMANRNLDEDEWQQFMGKRPYHEICPDLP